MVPKVRGGLAEFCDQEGVQIRCWCLLIQGRGHAPHPLVVCGVVDDEASMAHAKSRMTPLLPVEGRSAHPSTQELEEFFSGSRRIGRQHRSQDGRRFLDLVVEGIHQLFDPIASAQLLIRGGAQRPIYGVRAALVRCACRSG